MQRVEIKAICAGPRLVAAPRPSAVVLCGRMYYRLSRITGPNVVSNAEPRVAP